LAFSLFSLFNALIPKDQTSRRIARGLPYGPHQRQLLDIYAPRGAGPWPVVIFIYGGSWMDGDRSNYEFAGRAIAALGYLVVIADYRLIPDIEYPGFLDDCADAFGWIMREIATYGGDPQRVALMGHSAGAYNAAMLALDPRYRLRVPELGRLACVVGLSGPYDFFPFDGPISLRTFGAVRDPQATQPVHHVYPGAPPMLFGHGGKDSLVLPRNATALATRLGGVGVSADETHYANLGHPGPLLALSRPLRWVAPVYADIAAYLAQMLR
jgi:acetyl esterase/lipase